VALVARGPATILGAPGAPGVHRRRRAPPALRARGGGRGRAHATITAPGRRRVGGTEITIARGGGRGLSPATLPAPGR
jgi:hypothetical protein